MTIEPLAAKSITLDRVREVVTQHATLYHHRTPLYQASMLRDLEKVWVGQHDKVIDIGAGTGLMAEAIQTLLPAGHVTAVDVVDRYFKTLSVETAVYDGSTLPYVNACYDAATINNVMHHVPVSIRFALMNEVCRVVDGPIYIKDHLALSRIDRWRLGVLDAIGNIPFAGQVKANYLSLPDWEELAANCGRRIGARTTGIYRHGIMAAIFPNRLEVTFRLDKA